MAKEEKHLLIISRKQSATATMLVHQRGWQEGREALFWLRQRAPAH